MRCHRRPDRGNSLARLLLLSLVGASWQTPRDACAESAVANQTRSAVSSTTPLVELRVVGTEESFLSLRQALGEQRLGKADLRWSLVERFAPLQILSLSSRDKVIVHCWIDLSDPELAHLYFAAPKHDRFMMRDFELEHRFGTLELTSLVQIVETAVAVLLTDADAGMSRREVEAVLTHPGSPPVRAATPPPSTAISSQSPTATVRYGWLADAGYAFRQYSREIALLHGPTMTLGLERVRDNTRQWLQISAGYAFPSRVSGTTASADIQRTTLAVSTAYLWGFPQMPSQAIGPRATVGIGYVRAAAISGDLPGVYDLELQQLSTEPYVGLGTDFMVTLGLHGAVIARLDFEAVLRPVRHVIWVNGDEAALSEGRHFRVGTSLGLLFH